MAFKGFGRGVQDKLNSWYLPQRILDRFFRALTPLVDAEPPDLDRDSYGMFFAAEVEDCDNRGHYYRFDLRISRNDTDFWISDIAGYGVDDNGDPIWSSNTTL